MNLHQKLIEVRKTCSYLKKDNEGFQFSYVSSSQTLGTLRQAMDQYGLLLIPRVLDHSATINKKTNTDRSGNKKDTIEYFTELTMEFTWVDSDDPEQSITCPFYAQGVDAREMGVGKALTYGEKYFLLKFFNIATDKDDPDSFQQKTESARPYNPTNDIQRLSECSTEQSLLDWWNSLSALAQQNKEVNAAAGIKKKEIQSTQVTPEEITPQQRKAIQAAYSNMDRSSRLTSISAVVGREISSVNELTKKEAAKVIDNTQREGF